MADHQQRYLAHQARKRDVLQAIVAERHSERTFANNEVPQEYIDSILVDLSCCPSSCDRRGVSATYVTNRDMKALLGGLLVGGVGWIHRAPVVVLYFANLDAYQAPGEEAFMPYIDAGCMVMQCYLSCVSLGLRSCYCNPNIREINKEHFYKVFADNFDGRPLFCGAHAIGHPPEGV